MAISVDVVEVSYQEFSQEDIKSRLCIKEEDKEWFIDGVERVLDGLS